jgi:uncharacterized membrane protein
MSPATIRTIITIIWIALSIACLVIAVKGKTSDTIRVVFVVVALLLLLVLGGCFYLGQQFSRVVQ